MINLLPPAEKKKLFKEYVLRLGVVLFSAVFLLEVLSVVFFIPSFYSLYLSTSDLARTLSDKQTMKHEGAKEAEASLAAIKKKIEALKPPLTDAAILPSLLVKEIVAQKPIGIELSGFSYTRTGETATMQFSGNAFTQEDLLAFRRNVKENPRVLDFKYGSSFITQKTDINFSAVVTLK